MTQTAEDVLTKELRKTPRLIRIVFVFLVGLSLTCYALNLTDQSFRLMTDSQERFFAIILISIGLLSALAAPILLASEVYVRHRVMSQLVECTERENSRTSLNGIAAKLIEQLGALRGGGESSVPAQDVPSRVPVPAQGMAREGKASGHSELTESHEVQVRALQALIKDVAYLIARR